MPRYWGIHNVVHLDEERKHLQGRDWIYRSVPVSEEMRAGDFVYLFRDREYLYGWGTIRELGTVSASTRDVTVTRVLLEPGLATLDEINNNPVFHDWTSIRRENLSSFNPDQTRYLNTLCKRNGSAPPDPNRSLWEDTWEVVERSTQRGNQGSVTKVRRRNDGKIGALKELHEDHLYREERRYRMQQEVNALRALMRLRENNGTPEVLDDNSQDWDKPGMPLFVVMEWIDGVALDQFANRGASIEEAVDITTRLLDIIDKCHGIDIHHRDLKPDNIILRTGHTADPVLVDFGMSWSKPSGDETRPFETEAGQELGNRFLRLPEFAPGRNVRDSRSDLTMLVGILFFLVFRRAPRQLSDEMRRMPHERDPLPEEIVNDHRWPKLRRLFSRGFQFSLDDRFQLADELRRALEALSVPQDRDLVEEALQNLADLRTSDDVQRRKAAKEHFQTAHEEITRIIASLNPEATGLEHRNTAAVTSDGRAGDFQCQFFRPKGGLRDIIFEHRLRLEATSYVASMRVVDNNADLRLEDWWEYYRGPAGNWDLLQGDVTEKASIALAQVINSYKEAMTALLDRNPSVEI